MAGTQRGSERIQVLPDETCRYVIVLDTEFRLIVLTCLH